MRVPHGQRCDTVSVQEGLAYVSQHFAPEEDAAWLLAPADMPQITSAAINRVLAEPLTPGEIIAPAFRGQRGHPVRFPWSLAAEVGSLGADEGVNAIVKRHTVREVEWTDDTILNDVDTPQDYLRLQNRRESN